MTHIDVVGQPGFVGQLVPSTEARIVTGGDPAAPPAPGVADELAALGYVDVAAGETGELMVRGPQIMQGYLDRDDETATTLLSGGWLRTGDIALAVDGARGEPASFPHTTTRDAAPREREREKGDFELFTRDCLSPF